MKKYKMKVAVLAAASFCWISLASAQGPEGGHMRRQGGPGFGPGGGPGGPGGPPLGPPMGMIAEHLGLTDDQKAQWKEIHEKAREGGEPLLKAAGAAKEAFDKALDAENAEASTVGQAAIAMRNAHRAVGAHHKATFDAVKAILTPEQLAKFEEMEKHRGPGPSGMRPGGPQGGRPGGGPLGQGPLGQGPQRRKGPGGSK